MRPWISVVATAATLMPLLDGSQADAQNKTPSFGTTYTFFGPGEWSWPDDDEPVLDANFGAAGQGYTKGVSWSDTAMPPIAGAPSAYGGQCSIPRFKSFLQTNVAARAVAGHGSVAVGTLIEQFPYASAPGATPAEREAAAIAAMTARRSYLISTGGYASSQLYAFVGLTYAGIGALPEFYSAWATTAMEQIYFLAVCEQSAAAQQLKGKGALAVVYSCHPTSGGPFHALYRGLNGKNSNGTIGFRNIAANLGGLDILSGDAGHPIGFVTLSPAVKNVIPSRQGEPCCGLWFTAGDNFIFELDTKCTLTSLSSVALDRPYHTESGAPGTVCHNELVLDPITWSAAWDGTGTRITVSITGPSGCEEEPSNPDLDPGWTGQYWIIIPWDAVRSNGNQARLDGNTCPWYDLVYPPDMEECDWNVDMNPYHSGEGKSKDNYVFDPYCGFYFGIPTNKPAGCP